MLIFRFSKLSGGEFISHLDILRHIGKTLIRAKIATSMSQGFNPHMQIYLSPPVYVGLKTIAEYCLIDTDERVESFVERFNEFSPKGIKCLSAFNVGKRYKIAGDINSAEYSFDNAANVDAVNILNRSEILFEVKGELKDIRPKILDLKIEENRLIARLAFGNNTLRADIFERFLYESYGLNSPPMKINAYINGVLPEDFYEKL